MPPGQTSRPSKKHETFKEIKIHTAKCDECDKHNAHTIYRCLDCSLQCCTPCWEKKGGDGKHVINSVIATAGKPVIVKADSAEQRKQKKQKIDTPEVVRTGREISALLENTVINLDEEEDYDSFGNESSKQTKKPLRSRTHFIPVEDDEEDEVLEYDDSRILSPKNKSLPNVAPKQIDRSSGRMGPVSLSQFKGTAASNKSGREYEHHERKRSHGAGTEADNTCENRKTRNTAAKSTRHEGRKSHPRRLSSNTTTLQKSAFNTSSSKDQEDPEIVTHANYLIDFSRDAFAADPTGPLFGSKSKQAGEPTINKALEVPLIRSPNGQADTGEVDLTKGNFFRFKKAGRDEDNKMSIGRVLCNEDEYYGHDTDLGNLQVDKRAKAQMSDFNKEMDSGNGTTSPKIPTKKEYCVCPKD